ncbi:uncharacterized protein UBRO_16081 [Ustilago bromivora]|uniref:Uncharacterized protein n=2 Tax=Ustilago bromivora TaxID=307758 RepID=A0A1K0G0Q8_9BASI|nr:uncharacterized protein UBRO_16081 [Ustilago bromivora]
MSLAIKAPKTSPNRHSAALPKLSHRFSTLATAFRSIKMSSLSVTHAFEDGRFIQSTFTSESGLTTVLPKGFVDDIVNDIALSDYSDATDAERYQIFRDAFSLCLIGNTLFDDCPFEILLDEDDEYSVDPSFKEFADDTFPPVSDASSIDQQQVFVDLLLACQRLSKVCREMVILRAALTSTEEFYRRM